MTDTPDGAGPEREPDRDDDATPPQGTPAQEAQDPFVKEPSAPSGAPPGYGPPPGYGSPPGHGGPPAPGYGPQPGYGGYGGQPAYGAQPGYGLQPGYPAPGYGAAPGQPPGGIVPLAPLGIGQILGGAFGYIRANPVSTLVAAALIFVVAAVVQGLAQVLPALAVGGSIRSAGSAVGAVGVSLLASLAGAVVSLLASALVTGVLLVVLRRALLGRRTSPGEAWRGATRRVWGLVGANLLVGLIIGGIATVGILLAFIIGIAGRNSGGVIAVAVVVGLAVLVVVVYLAVLLSMTPAAYMMEDIGVTTALGRSRALVRGSWWRIFGIQLLAGIVLGAIALVIFLILGALFGVSLGSLARGGSGLSVTGAVLTGSALAIFIVVAGTFFTPFVTGITGLLYTDQRIRRERFDLELAARAAGQTGPGQPW